MLGCPFITGTCCQLRRWCPRLLLSTGQKPGRQQPGVAAPAQRQPPEGLPLHECTPGLGEQAVLQLGPRRQSKKLQQEWTQEKPFCAESVVLKMSKKPALCWSRVPSKNLPRLSGAHLQQHPFVCAPAGEARSPGAEQMRPAAAVAKLLPLSWPRFPPPFFSSLLFISPGAAGSLAPQRLAPTCKAPEWLQKRCHTVLLAEPLQGGGSGFVTGARWG